MFNKIYLGCLFALSLHLSAFAQSFDRVIVFGDSWSDTGNAYSIAGEFVLPSSIYPFQRYSSGVAWVDHLADHMVVSRPVASRVNSATGTGYAYATAELSDGSYQFFFQDVYHVGAQVNRYLSNPYMNSTGTELVTLFAGGNNILNGDAGPYLQEMADLSRYIDLLYADGVRHFMLPNMPDLSLLPNHHNSELQRRSALFRDEFYVTVNALKAQYEDAAFYVPDFYQTILDIYADPEAYGFKSSLKDYSYRDHFPKDYHTFYMWVDEIHPSARLHAELANVAYTSLMTVPEASGMMLLGTLGGVLCVRRKRSFV